MSRNIPSAMLASLTTHAIVPALLASIGFKSGTQYVWSGVGNLVYNGNTYRGVGSLGRISHVTEGSDVQAYGMNVTLSGIDATLLSESLTDVQLGAPATVYFALLDQTGAILGTPYPLFKGVVDKPLITPGIKEVSISLALESKLSNLTRANYRRYTSADQNLYYPGDSAFNWVESLNDQALKWAP